MRKIKVNDRLSLSLLNQYNAIVRTEDICLVFDNTRGISSELLKQADPNISFSILGGLNPIKNKYNNDHYQKRTYYSRNELISIIEKFASIERSIDPTWDDFEKTMFVYKCLCEYLDYEETEINYRDASRNLLGMINGKSVCSGCAIIFKEAMDRIGINCLYQNSQNKHSWNVVEIDGHYYAIELTWDINEKQNNTCGFRFFCREDRNSFYNDCNGHHNIKDEIEEKEYNFDIVPYNKLQSTLSKISIPKSFNTNTYYYNNEEVANVNGYKVQIKNNLPIYPNNTNGTFVRQDGSSFLLIPTNKFCKGVWEYLYVEYSLNSKIVSFTKIFSEMDLLIPYKDIRYNIANNLLSKNRVKNKINNYNGYVGYVVPNDNRKYYNVDFEENVINKF